MQGILSRPGERNDDACNSTVLLGSALLELERILAEAEPYTAAWEPALRARYAPGGRAHTIEACPLDMLPLHNPAAGALAEAIGAALPELDRLAADDDAVDLDDVDAAACDAIDTFGDLEG